MAIEYVPASVNRHVSTESRFRSMSLFLRPPCPTRREADDAVESRAEGTGDDLEDHLLAGAGGEPIGIDVAGLAERADKGGRQNDACGPPGSLGSCSFVSASALTAKRS